MTIKRQFHLLIAGIILLPLLAVTGFTIFQRLTREEKQLALPVYEEIAPLLQGSLGPLEWQDIARYLRHIRPDMDIVILRRLTREQQNDLMVIFSTTGDFTAGQPLDREKLTGLFENTGGRYNYIFESPPWQRGEDFFVLQRIDRASSRPPRPMYFIGQALVSVISIIVLFVIIMSVIILRSITRSVLALENATARISRGELDLVVDAGGSNEITSLVRSLNSMRLSLKEEELRRSRFIMGVSHDLKTPLALIKGYAEAIEDGLAADPAALRQSTGIISAKVEQLVGMVDGLIDFVRIDSREWRLALKAVNLRAFLAGFVTRIQNDAALLRRSVSSRLDIGRGLQIPMDEGLVIRALENIVNNAIRYTREGGQIMLSAWEEGPEAVIEIADNGPGIKQEDLGQVFEMFYRGSASRREQGMGMGLAVVKSIIELHNWRIEALRASPGPESGGLAGACFRITIPLERS